ncbi:LysR family transcriptional regulator [Demequina gelatinilytica]|uniref:LysR family transcriptional regulator n=1 Tax=Demequina gelatinilytica TaxID=1638980 RepID=UPI0007828DA2|nr:LysR family transcriptional regulator [Demequina gelatinilytica]
MELRHLRYFAAVVEAGSVTAAAQALHMSQPPLSVAIQKLEAEVGVPLLVRTPRGVEPTSAGRFLLDQSSRVLGDVDDMIAALGCFGAGTAGALTMAAVPALLWHRVPRLLRAYAEVAPEVEIRLVDPPPWTAIDMVQQRKVDLAAIMVADADRFARRHRGALDVVDWGDVPLVAALPPGRDDAPDPLPLAWFDGATVVMPRGTAAVPSLPEAVAATFRRHGVAPARVRTVETIQTSVPLVEAGLASAVLPDPDRASLARFDLTLRRIVPEPRPLRALVLTRAGAGRDPLLGRLLARIAGSSPGDRM